MTPSDLVYKSAFDQLNKLGFSQRDCETGGAEAVRMYRRNTRATDAIAKAVMAQKKIGVKRA